MRSIIIILGLIYNFLFIGTVWTNPVDISIQGELSSAARFAFEELHAAFKQKGIDCRVNFKTEKTESSQLIIEIKTSQNENQQQ